MISMKRDIRKKTFFYHRRCQSVTRRMEKYGDEIQTMLTTNQFKVPKTHAKRTNKLPKP